MKPTVLIIAPDYPYPPIEGGLLRVYHLIAALGDDYAIDLLALSQPTAASPCNYPSLDRWCRRIDVIPATFPPKDLPSQLRRLIYCVRRRLSPRSDVYVNDTVMRQVANTLAGRSYDLVIFEHSWIASYLSLVQNVLTSPSRMILDLHNIESNLKKDFARHSDRFPRSWINRMFADFAARQERHWLPEFDHLFTTSEHDKQRVDTMLQESGRPVRDTNIAVIPNCIDLTFYGSIRRNSGQRKRLLFCGGLDFPPNRTAIELLVGEVFPRIRMNHHDCELWIVGKDDPHWTKPQAAGVIFTGCVDDIRPYIEDATMILAPILNGSGTRLKVLEAWAARRPLVATTKAVEGLHATPMAHFRLADTATDFVEGINHILHAPQETQQMVDAAYRFVGRHYDSQIIGKHVREVLTALSNGHTPPVPPA